MSGTRPSGIVLFATIALILISGVGLVIRGVFVLEERHRELNETSLRRTQQLVQVRLDGLFHELAEDLREEAVAVTRADSSKVIERWFPLLRTHWPILSIQLADELGNETALMRQDSAYLVRRTALGSKDGPPILMNYGQDAEPLRGPWLDEEDEDPRRHVWFSKALEETRDEPVWSLVETDSLSPPLLQVSYLIRSATNAAPFRIMSFTVDISRSDWLDTRSTAFSRSGILLIDDEGRTLYRSLEEPSGDIARSMDLALSQWREERSRSPFTIYRGEHRTLSLILPYVLPGQQLNTGVILDLEPMGTWMGPERRALTLIGALLAVLIALLLVAWSRKRRSDERIRKQAKRNRSQELKLAKALGEREVLNREVHHRVKNNLQVVSSLLNLQAMRLEDGPIKNEFLRGKRRIDTIALVHHKLYGLSDLRNVDLDLFFKDLVAALKEMHRPQSNTVSHDVDTSATKADQDTAIELGIILCELVANTYQHAFPYATGGHVEIKVRMVEGDLYRLTVKDNGVGIEAGGAQGQGKLGLEIVEALSEQLDGSFHMRTKGGVQFEVLFRMQREAAVAEVNEPDADGAE